MIKFHEIAYIVPIIFTIITVFIFLKNINLLGIIGFTIAVIGIFMIFKGHLDIGDSISILPKAKKLVTKGIYKNLRHPIYFGVIIALFGWVIILKSIKILIFTFVILVLFLVRAHFEEKKLQKKFGKKYQEYKKKTIF